MNKDFKKQLISVVVPCFNEQESLLLFYDEITKVSKEMIKNDFEFIFVDDGSKDETINILKRLAEKDSKVKYISFSRNFGKESAIHSGLKNSKGDYVVIMDADLQDPPSLLPKMLEIIQEEGIDAVATRRITRNGEPMIRSFFARKFYKIMNRISEAELVDGARDYRLMTKKFVNAVLSLSEKNRFTKGMFGWVGFKTKWLEYENIERVAGQTKWSFWKLFKYAINGITAFSDFPLYISVFIGIISIFLSICGIIGLFISIMCSHYMMELLIVSVVLLCSGILSISIGLLGKYIANIYRETKNRPDYIIKEDNIKEK